MGRPRSCFQIIACGCDSNDNDEVDALVIKDSKDKRGWSFRKRSTQHRVLNNTVIAETSLVKKENLKVATIDFKSSVNSIVSEKPTIIHFTNEEAHVPTIWNPKGSHTVDVSSDNGTKVDSQVEETIVTVIQAGIRGILAQRDLLKLKNVVKVQAAVRGFLVRRRAVGTLRCAQAIVKMQAIVRARRAHLSIERSAQDEIYKKSEKENHDLNTAAKGEMTKSNTRYISIEKLLTNSFARQLLESAPRHKPINIKCIPSKNDSAWKWLERWFAVTSLDALEPNKEVSVTEQIERETEKPEKVVSVIEQMERETKDYEKDISVVEEMERKTKELEKEVLVSEQMESETEELNKEVLVTERMEKETEGLEEEISVNEQMKKETEELEEDVSVTEEMERETEELEEKVPVSGKMERETDELEEEVSVTEQIERETKKLEEEQSVTEEMERETELKKEVSVTEKMGRETEEIEEEISVTKQIEKGTDKLEKEEPVTNEMERETDELKKEVLNTKKMEGETEELEKEVSVTEHMERETNELEKTTSSTVKMERETKESKNEESDTVQMLREIEESHVVDIVESKALSETEDLNSSIVKSILPYESKDVITYDSSNLQYQTNHSLSLSVIDYLDEPEPENARSSEVKKRSSNVSSVQDQKIQLNDAGLQTESCSSSDKSQMEMEQTFPINRITPMQLENDGKKFVLGSRKVSDPLFINAQEKFEQLDMATGSIGTVSSMHQDDGTKLHPEEESSASENENIFLPESRIVQVGGSERGTKLFTSSTIDSPDRFEAGLADTHAISALKTEVHDHISDLSTKVIVRSSSTTIHIDVQLLLDQQEESNKSNGRLVTSISVVDSTSNESKLASSSDEQKEHDISHDHQSYRSSPEASPRSNLTAPESHETSSSQVSIKTKWDKVNKTISYQKLKSLSAEKKSPSSVNRNFARRSSTGNSIRYENTVNRKNSFDLARQENVENELKETSSSNSLPRFMQATQSTRAKLHSINSQRSSSDAQDREIYIKKRHSLPAEIPQGSPRILQGAKRNEKTWRRK